MEQAQVEIEYADLEKKIAATPGYEKLKATLAYVNRFAPQRMTTELEVYVTTEGTAGKK